MKPCAYRGPDLPHGCPNSGRLRVSIPTSAGFRTVDVCERHARLLRGDESDDSAAVQTRPRIRPAIAAASIPAPPVESIARDPVVIGDPADYTARLEVSIPNGARGPGPTPFVRLPRDQWQPGICILAGCIREARRRGLCDSCYQRARKYDALDLIGLPALSPSACGAMRHCAPASEVAEVGQVDEVAEVEDLRSDVVEQVAQVSDVMLDQLAEALGWNEEEDLAWDRAIVEVLKLRAQIDEVVDLLNEVPALFDEQIEELDELRLAADHRRRQDRDLLLAVVAGIGWREARERALVLLGGRLEAIQATALGAIGDHLWGEHD